MIYWRIINEDKFRVFAIKSIKRKIVKKINFRTKHIDTKNGKLPTSHRYNRLPLLRSHPGGFTGAGCVGLAGANIEILYDIKRILK